MDFIEEKIEEYAFAHTQQESELLQDLEKETHAQLEIPQMLTGRIEGRFLKLLVLLTQAKRVLEIGTFSGYGALSMAEGLPEDGAIITCDNDPDAIAFAQSYFVQSPHGKKITLMEGPALETIKTLEGPFDMVFIDADKENYLNYYEAALKILRPGGLIVADNVLWSGRVLDPQDSSDIAIDQFNKKVRNDTRVDQVMLTVRDGIFCIRKK